MESFSKLAEDRWTNGTSKYAYQEHKCWVKAIEIVKQGGVTKDCNNCANYTEPDEVDNGCYLCCKGYENNYEPKVDNGSVSDDVCEWKYNNSEYYFESSCDHLHIFMSDGPKENEYDCCPYCGKKIKEVE